MTSFQHNRRKFMAACVSLVALCFSPALQKKGRPLRQITINTIEDIKPGMKVCGTGAGLFTIVERAESPCFYDGKRLENYKRELFWGVKPASSQRVLLCFYDFHHAQKAGVIEFYA